ncbi:hypothetical protein WDZ92_45435, partial [Nostoc sp. NIES-2111]
LSFGELAQAHYVKSKMLIRILIKFNLILIQDCKRLVSYQLSVDRRQEAVVKGFSLFPSSEGLGVGFSLISRLVSAVVLYERLRQRFSVSAGEPHLPPLPHISPLLNFRNL